jgi:hypothetical protein
VPANPYEPPGSVAEASSAIAGRGCPHCGSHQLKDPTYTFWGGVLGPRLLRHRVCSACGFGFDRETGRDNRGRIVAYVLISGAIALVLCALLVLIFVFAA